MQPEMEGGTAASKEPVILCQTAPGMDTELLGKEVLSMCGENELMSQTLSLSWLAREWEPGSLWMYLGIHRLTRKQKTVAVSRHAMNWA